MPIRQPPPPPAAGSCCPRSPSGSAWSSRSRKRGRLPNQRHHHFRWWRYRLSPIVPRAHDYFFSPSGSFLRHCRRSTSGLSWGDACAGVTRSNKRTRRRSKVVIFKILFLPPLARKVVFAFLGSLSGSELRGRRNHLCKGQSWDPQSLLKRGAAIFVGGWARLTSVGECPRRGRGVICAGLFKAVPFSLRANWGSAGGSVQGQNVWSYLKLWPFPLCC